MLLENRPSTICGRQSLLGTLSHISLLIKLPLMKSVNESIYENTEKPVKSNETVHLLRFRENY